MALYLAGTQIVGFYESTWRVAIIATQAANSRIWEVQNPSATKIIIPVSIRVIWLPTAAHTAAIETSLDLFKCTSFSAADNVSTSTPATSKRKTAYPASIATLVGLTATGVAAGMTGGTLTKDGGPLAQIPQWLLATLPTAANVVNYTHDFLDDLGADPLVLVQNEGLELENRILLGAAAGSSVYIRFVWAEATTG